MMVLRKIKEKIRKMGQGKLVRKKTTTNKLRKTEESPVKMKRTEKEVLGAQEMAVETTKFSHPEITRPRRLMPQDLPYEYGQDKIVLQVRDPWWLHTYWELKSQTIDGLRNELKDDFLKARRVLRVYDISHIVFNGRNAHRFFDMHISEHARDWYINAGGPGRSWCVDLGLLLADGRFITILRSNTVATPSDGPSGITDEEWMIPEEMFARLYGMGFGFGQSSPIGKAWQERMKQALFSGVLSSPGVTSSGVPLQESQRQRKFWLRVDCELIVYGATEPDAAVTVQGKPIVLRPDGTFTLRFALPDGEQVIPVQAVSADQLEERVITPIVSRQTQYQQQFTPLENEVL